MTTHAIDTRANELAAINRRLADLLNQQPAALVEGADVALCDDLVVCGVLGGKDVGKSTLINALAGTTVSVDRDEVGEGTSRPRAYIHRDAEAALHQRLRLIAEQVTVDVTFHDVAAIRSLILIDMPDFDSDFADHLRVVRQVSPLLDRIVWVMTPRKIVDRAWVEMTRSVLKDESNTYCVLNKLDELLADDFSTNALAKTGVVVNGDPAERFWASQLDWFQKHLQRAGFVAKNGRSFQLAAAFPSDSMFVKRIGALWDDPDWKRFASDRAMVTDVAKRAAGEMSRLRTVVLSPVSESQARIIKQANSSIEHEANAQLIRKHFELDRLIEQLAPVNEPAYQQQILNEAFGPDYCSAVAEGIRKSMRSDRELADEILERRVEHWPLLRLVHWPFGWLSRLIGRGLAMRADVQPYLARNPFDVNGRSVTERVGALHSRLLSDMGTVVDRAGLNEKLPATDYLVGRVEAQVHSLVSRTESDLLYAVWPIGRRPSIFARAFLWFILLWFPIVQPLLEGGLQMYRNSGSFDLVEGAYHIVSTLSALHLGVSLLVVIGIFVAVLSLLYSGSLRKLKRLMSKTRNDSLASQNIDECLTTEILGPMLEPFRELFVSLHEINRKLWRHNER